MKMPLTTLATVLVFSLGAAKAQSVLFDFDNAPLHTPLPVDLTVGGITAHFSGNPSYYNYSIQRADALGFTPVGFAGYCIYPSTVFTCDLLISFNRALSDISILYAPEEYDTDSSCTMRITAYFGSTVVGTNTHTIPIPGTWPTGTLSLNSAQPFDNVVIHYDHAPVTGGDYGPIFMVDNLMVTEAPVPTPLAAVSRKTHGAAGDFDVDLPLTGTPGIECRAGGATDDYEIVVAFGNVVAVNGTPQAQVTTGTGTVGSGGVSNGGLVTISGSTVTVPLTNVANAQTVDVTLVGVSVGSATGNVVVRMSRLVADINGNGSVNATDISQTKFHSGQAIDATNFRADVTASGSINATDVSIIKSNSGSSLP